MTLQIFQEIILPIYILIIAGVFLHRKFKLDLYTLAKVNFYFLIPPVVFVKIYQSDLSIGLLGAVVGFYFLLYILLYVSTILLSFLFKIEKDKKQVFLNSSLLTNQGNFGLPVNELAFKGDPFAMSIQIIIMTTQNFITFTYGIFSLDRKKDKRLFSSLITFLKMPIFMALCIGLIFNFFDFTVPVFLIRPLENAAQAFLALALMTLGAQVAFLNMKAFLFPSMLSSICKLVVSPVLAYGIIYVFNIEGVLAQAMFIASAFPTASNSALLALEYKNNPEFAGQAVLVSTLLSSITVSIVIYFSHILF